MDLQSVYYIMAITFMSLLVLTLAGMIAIIIFIALKVSEVQKMLEKKVDEVTAPFRKGSELIDNLRDLL